VFSSQDRKRPGPEAFHECEGRTLEDAKHHVGRSVLVRSSCTETNNHCQRAIDFAKLAKREEPVGFAEPGRIHGTELLDEDSRSLTVDFHFGPE